MKRLAWLTDVHLNFVTPPDVAMLASRIKASATDALLLSGDIAEADTFADALRLLAADSGVTIYFVLGNHDYYRGSIATVRREAASLSRESSLVHWLPDTGIVRLTSQTALVGHGGWGDGRCGDFLQSDIVLNDYLLIQELRELQGDQAPVEILTPRLLAALHSLGDQAAEHFRQVLPAALKTSDHVIVLTHVPPFHEACWHDDQLSDRNWSPHFTCQAVGDVLLEVMSAHPHRTATVLCGHTHSSGRAQILNNLEVLTGDAVYGQPRIQQIIEVE